MDGWAIGLLLEAGAIHNAFLSDRRRTGPTPHAREVTRSDSAEDWASKGVPNSIMLAKPFAPAQLVTAVAQLINGGAPAA